MISVVIPTIAGREGLLKKTQDALRESADCEFVVVRNRRTCGEAWNEGAKVARREYLCLLGDDLIPQPGWAEAAMDAADNDVYPAPLLRERGRLLCAGSLGQGLYVDGADGMPVYNSPIPFLRREKWAEVGPSLALHYYADDFLSYRARFCAGLSVEVRRAFAFDHLDGQVGKQRNVALETQYRIDFAQAAEGLYAERT